MEKSLAARSEKVSNNIPNDIAFSILSKLPPKSLSRFGCAHKSWSLLFENPYFMNIYRNNFISRYHSYYDDTSILLLQPVFGVGYEFHSNLYLLSGERFENKEKLDLTLPLQEFLHDYAIILGSSSVNGILCLTNWNIAALWNPAIDEFKIIPPSSIESLPYPHNVVYHGFGYDHVKNDYKVIRYVDFFRRACDDPEDEFVQDIYLESMWEIYSIQSNSWKKLNVNMSIVSEESDGIDRVYIDGMCHWLGINYTNIDVSYDVESYLVSFDLVNEVFFTTLMPNDDFDSGVWRYLVILNGSMALISHYKRMSTFYISILGEVGVKESWIKLFTVESLSCVERPIGAGKNGDIFFIRNDDGDKFFVGNGGELACIDLSTQMVEQLGVKSDDIYDQIVIYKKSLVSIGE